MGFQSFFKSRDGFGMFKTISFIRRWHDLSWNWLIDWLIIYGFTSRSRIFHLYGDVTIAGEGLQNFGLCSALRAFEQGGIFIVPHLLWHGTSVFPVSSEGPAPFSRLLRHTRGCGGSILTRILTGGAEIKGCLQCVIKVLSFIMSDKIWTTFVQLQVKQSNRPEKIWSQLP
jgi:hypothetical protein